MHQISPIADSVQQAFGKKEVSEVDYAVVAQENMLTKGPELQKNEMNSSQFSGFIGGKKIDVQRAYIWGDVRRGHDGERTRSSRESS